MRPPILLFLLSTLATAAPGQAVASRESHQFDFWIGAWDVNLRVKHPDGSWHDDIQAREYTYSILDDKAILELWSETSREKGVRGFSLRYYRDDIAQWELWLNWPGRNTSGASYLRGGFRHNRGEFFSDTKQSDSTTLTWRYTFSDITPTSLRWDDAFTTDHGKSWGNAWIMEFSRVAATAPPLSVNTPANSYATGALCDSAQFRQFEQLSGEMRGAMKYRAGAADAWKTSPATFTTYKIIGGCATMSFLEYARDGATYKRFSHNTYNTASHAYEVGELDNLPGAVYRSLAGQKSGSRFDLSGVNVDTQVPTDRKSIWTVEGNGFKIEEYRKIGDSWVSVGEGSFTHAR